MNSAVHFSSAKTDWETPQELFDRLNAIFRFTIDVCATARNAKCRRYFCPPGYEPPEAVYVDDRYSMGEDGLEQSWEKEICWMNPPYGRDIGRWCAKACFESRNRNSAVIALLPARTDTQWWQNWVRPYALVDFLPGRLRFGGCKTSAPFPSAIAYYWMLKE